MAPEEEGEEEETLQVQSTYAAMKGVSLRAQQTMKSNGQVNGGCN